MPVRTKAAGRVPRWLSICLLALPLLAACATTPYDQGRHALSAGDHAAAIEAFDAALAEGIQPFASLRERGAARLAAGDVEAALVDLESARKQRPQDPRLLWLLGRAHHRAGHFEQAAADYRAYEERSTSRSTRQQVRLTVAQLKDEMATSAADALLAARRAGTEPEPNTVAVYAFMPYAEQEASLQDQKVCRALNIWVSADLAKVSSIRSLAADQMEALYAEQSFSYENRQYFHPSSLVAAGNLQPARHMVRGVYGSLPDAQVLLGAACFDAADNTTGTCSELQGTDADLFDLETRLVLDILGSMGIEPTAEERIAIGEKPTRDLQAFLAFADGVYLRDIGSYEEAADAFEQAAEIDPEFQMAKDAAADAQLAELGGSFQAMVPPPVLPSTAGNRAMGSAMQLGLGLIPDTESGDAQDGGTTDLVTTRGTATLRVTATAGGD